MTSPSKSELRFPTARTPFKQRTVETDSCAIGCRHDKSVLIYFGAGCFQGIAYLLSPEIFFKIWHYYLTLCSIRKYVLRLQSVWNQFLAIGTQYLQWMRAIDSRSVRFTAVFTLRPPGQLWIEHSIIHRIITLGLDLSVRADIPDTRTIRLLYIGDAKLRISPRLLFYFYSLLRKRK